MRRSRYTYVSTKFYININMKKMCIYTTYTKLKKILILYFSNVIVYLVEDFDFLLFF